MAPRTGAEEVRGELDLESVRSRFPALASGYVFLDNAGGSQVLGAVADRVRDYLLSTSVQLGASYEVSQRAAERVAEANRAAAQLVGAAEPAEIALGASSSQLLFSLSRALSREIAPGDEIVVTNADHEANVTPWLRMAEERGAVVRVWNVDRDSWRLEPAALLPLLGPKTRLVAFAHVSNILGTLNPVAEAVRTVRATTGDRARVVVDGVSYAPHRAVDVRAWDVDFYVFSLYKVFGPHQGLLYGKRERLLSLGSINHLTIPEDAIPYKLLPGSLNYELAHGLPAILAHLTELGGSAGEGESAAGRQALDAGFQAIARHEERLTRTLLSYLAGKRGVRIVGVPEADRERRVATVSFAVDGRNAGEIPPVTDRHRIGIRYGDFQSRRLITDLGLLERQGVVRVSMAHYNTTEEIDRLIERLDEALS